MPMKKPRQHQEKLQDAYEKEWTTNVPKNPCNLWNILSSLGKTLGTLRCWRKSRCWKSLNSLGKSFNILLGANLGNL